MYGTPVKLFVADAKYRVLKKWSSGTDIPELNNMDTAYGHVNPQNAIDDKSQQLTYYLYDSQLQERFPSLSTDKSSKENTDILVRYPDCEAANWCRAQNIDGIGVLDLPNAYELIVVYLESDRLDELDPTVDTHPEYKLGCTNPNGRFCLSNTNRCWTSTEATPDKAINVDCEGDLNINNGMKTTYRGVVPVKEL